MSEIKYTIIVEDLNTGEIAEYEEKNERKADKTARHFAKYKKNYVTVKWERPSDGMVAFYNRGIGHEFHRRRW